MSTMKNRHFVATNHFLVVLLLVALFGGCGVEPTEDFTTYTYKKVGALELKADVYGANAESQDSTTDVYGSDKKILKPVILWVHGGALIFGNRGEVLDDQLQAYLDSGYIVVSIDYRLAPETKLPEIVADLYDSMTWISEKGATLFGGDPERLAVVGRSAGGYLTLMAGLHPTVRPKALVSYYGYGDIVGDWYNTPDAHAREKRPISEREARAAVGTTPVVNDWSMNERGLFYLYTRQNGIWPMEVTGRDPRVDPEFFVPYCPVRNITKNYPATFLAHGGFDKDVPHTQSVMMADTLRRHRVTSELVTVRRAPHGFDSLNGGLNNPTNNRVFRRALAFLAKQF
jgi:acetyl esterase/lipase